MATQDDVLPCTMSKENITFRLDSEKREALNTIATAMDRDRSYLLNEAVQLYLELHQWQVEEIQQGIQEAEAEDFASDADVAEVFARLTQAAG